MTPRHTGRQLSLTEFAERAGIENPGTLRGYISRPLVGNPVPAPCGTVGTRGQWWCEKHADVWINNRPRKTKEQQ